MQLVLQSLQVHATTLFLICKYMQLVENCVFSLSLAGCTEIDTVFSLSLAGCSEMTGLQGKKGQGPQGTQKDLITRDSLKEAIRRIHAMGRRLLLHRTDSTASPADAFGANGAELPGVARSRPEAPETSPSVLALIWPVLPVVSANNLRTLSVIPWDALTRQT